MNTQSLTTNRNVTRSRTSRFVSRLVVLMVVASLGLHELAQAVRPASATGPDMATMWDMLQNGDGQLAIELVAQTADELGGWKPAPGDVVLFDRFLDRDTRGATLDSDEHPDFSNPKFCADQAACLESFRALEQQVRFGPSMFATPQEDGSLAVRPVFDDLLSTYIEEVGHSWQEYLYETEGRGSGARTRETTDSASRKWAAGREYQIKRYILSLDGSLIALSDAQRSNLTFQICEGYANPLEHEVPGYGAPAGWPNSEGWPTSNPTPDALATFCDSTAS